MEAGPLPPMALRRVKRTMKRTEEHVLAEARRLQRETRDRDIVERFIAGSRSAHSPRSTR